jgi:two-component system response regulator HydG
MMTTTQVENEVQAYAEDVFAGESAAVARLRLQVTRIAPHFRTALVTGELGVGKESVARELHRLSGVSAVAPFSAMEICSFAEGQEPVDLRGVMLLRGLDGLDPALQERLVERLKTIQRETKIVVSSECDLRSMLATGRMRQSLASRVGGLEIRVTPLRERMEDFDGIAAAMLSRLGGVGCFGADALQAMKKHSWPANLAELWSFVDQVTSVRGVIEPGDLPEMIALAVPDESGARLDKVMQRHVFEVLQRCSGNKLKTAELLGISRSTLYRMLDAAAE